MEAAGLAVNLLPLMVSVAENYQKLFLTPLNRYQDFSNEAGRYIVRLENQRAIFQTQCILLLSTVIDTPAASQIVSATHKLAPAAKAEVEERLKSVLGDSRTAIIGTIRAINAALLATQRECKELSETVEKEDKGKKVGPACQLVRWMKMLTSRRKERLVILTCSVVGKATFAKS